MNAGTNCSQRESLETEPGGSLLKCLKAPGPVRTPTCLVVAHPDDETIAMAGSLVRFTQLTVIHATNGAPRQLPVSAHGVTREQISRTRMLETKAALQAALATPIRQVRYHFTDGALIDDIDALVDRLAADLILSDAVVTHAYEGGHADHDLLSLAVHLACARLKTLTGRCPETVEFSGYFPRRGRACADGFSPAASSETIKIVLSPAARRRREMAMACHKSQEDNLRLFDRAVEHFRVAPNYDFASPLPEVLYSSIEQGLLHRTISRFF